MEESPEQILARLARYSDSLKRARPTSPVGHFHPIAVTPFHRWYGRHHDEFIPGAPLHRPLREAGGMLSSVSACVFALFAFISLGTGPATAVVAAMIVIGVVATWWRIPLALSWTIGSVVGAALVLLS